MRLIALEMVHGAAGSTTYRRQDEPVGAGRYRPRVRPDAHRVASLEPYREYLTIVSNTDCRNAEAFAAPEIGADHFRSAAVFLTQAKPKQTQGSDVFAGTSLDQIVAQKYGQETPIPSMQLCIENVDQAGGCSYNYSCVYTDTISWADPETPLPMIRDPRSVFDQLFGVGTTPEARKARRRDDKSILDFVAESVGDLKGARQGRPARDCPTTSRTCARSSGASRRSKRRTPAATRASCRARRLACPTRAKNT